MDKIVDLVENSAGGYDLIVERDAGNEIRILTGNFSLAFWKNMKMVAEDAIEEIEYNKEHGFYKGK